jgi:hypothetical protein
MLDLLETQKGDDPMTARSHSADVVSGGDTRFAPKDALTPVGQAYEVLHWGFVVLPVLAGLDKFFRVLANWDTFLAPPLARLSPAGVHPTMMAVGVIEVLAGLVVAVRPRIGGWVVAAWLAAIIVDLAILGNDWDIVLRDFVLMLSAIALARLGAAHERYGVA